MNRPVFYQDKLGVPEGAFLIEAYESARNELFYIDHPGLKKGSPEAIKQFESWKENYGESYIYFPWKNIFLHTVGESAYYKLRTARNKLVITEKEQASYRDLSIGIAGLSVGSQILSALVINGGPQKIKIADFDTLEITNLNRLNASLIDLGKNKAQIAAENAWELDPFLKLEIWEDGIGEDTLKKFLLEPKLSVFIDEMDSIDKKIKARLLAKKEGIPVLMATDNGDGVIIDVERFDLDKTLPIFHGLLEGVDLEDTKHLEYKDWLSLATKIVGPEYLSTRMQNSLLEIGNTIRAVPQLGTSAMVAGSLISYLIRKIVNNEALASGRYSFDFESIFDSKYGSDESCTLRKKQVESFTKAFKKKI